MSAKHLHLDIVLQHSSKQLKNIGKKINKMAPYRSSSATQVSRGFQIDLKRLFLHPFLSPNLCSCKAKCMSVHRILNECTSSAVHKYELNNVFPNQLWIQRQVPTYFICLGECCDSVLLCVRAPNIFCGLENFQSVLG